MITDGIFLDSYGNRVLTGTNIIIEGHYSFPHLIGVAAKVIWNQEKGLYQYIANDKIGAISDFWGVSKFKVLGK